MRQAKTKDTKHNLCTVKNAILESSFKEDAIELLPKNIDVSLAHVWKSNPYLFEFNDNCKKCDYYRVFLKQINFYENSDDIRNDRFFMMKLNNNENYFKLQKSGSNDFLEERMQPNTRIEVTTDEITQTSWDSVVVLGYSFKNQNQPICRSKIFNRQDFIKSHYFKAFLIFVIAFWLICFAIPYALISYIPHIKKKCNTQNENENENKTDESKSNESEKKQKNKQNLEPFKTFPEVPTFEGAQTVTIPNHSQNKWKKNPDGSWVLNL